MRPGGGRFLGATLAFYFVGMVFGAILARKKCGLRPAIKYWALIVDSKGDHRCEGAGVVSDACLEFLDGYFGVPHEYLHHLWISAHPLQV